MDGCRLDVPPQQFFNATLDALQFEIEPDKSLSKLSSRRVHEQTWKEVEIRQTVLRAEKEAEVGRSGKKEGVSGRRMERSEGLEAEKDVRGKILDLLRRGREIRRNGRV